MIGRETKPTLEYREAEKSARDDMRYFSVETIQSSIEHLQNYNSSWLIPAFVFASNDVDEGGPVYLPARHGTDGFLDRFFHGSLIGLPPSTNGKSLLRPRFSDVTLWQAGDEFEGDYVVRQGTKAWANLYSSRGYREMKLRGEIEMSSSGVRLCNSFQAALGKGIPDTFCFEHFLVWLFAFCGFESSVSGWRDLLSQFHSDLDLPNGFKSPYLNRFSLTENVPWPVTESERPSDVEFAIRLAPRLVTSLLFRQARS